MPKTRQPKRDAVARIRAVETVLRRWDTIGMQVPGRRHPGSDGRYPAITGHWHPVRGLLDSRRRLDRSAIVRAKIEQEVFEESVLRGAPACGVGSGE